MKAIDILESWIKTLNPDDKDYEIAMSRLKICNECPSKKNGFVESLQICSECGCPLSYKTKPVGKVFSKENKCPLSKW